MKSLVALLDRRKRDRPSTLVQVPFPSLSHSSQQEIPVPLPGSRRTSTPAAFMRPPLQHQAPSNSSPSRPLLLPESPAYPWRHSPAQSTSYYTDSDDGTLADPFAASTLVKTDLASSQSSLGTPRQPSPRRGSEPNATNPTPLRPFRFRSVDEPSTTPPVVNEHPSHSGAGKKGRWLRERRSLTSLLRPQPSISTEPVPTIPSLPLGTRAPERKPSTSFFTRGRSGSTPAAHTLQKPPISSKQIQLRTAPVGRPSTDDPAKDKALSRLVASAMGFPAPLETQSPDSWVRVGGVVQEQGSPTSARRRAVSVPARARPPQQTEAGPPVPSCLHVPRAPASEYGHSSPTPRGSLPLPTRRIEMSTDLARQNLNAHGARSASVSVPTPLKAGSRPIVQEGPALKHMKQSSMGGPEGMVLKSALKRRPVEQPTRDHQSSHLAQVKPLRISKRQGGAITQIPRSSLESNIKGLHATAIQQEPSVESTTPNSECPGGVAVAVRAGTTLKAEGSFGNVMRGHGLNTSDSRSLPVLDNIWGSFVSETAFGPLPPSPVASLNARHRASLSQEHEAKWRTSHSPASSYSSSSSSSHLVSSRGQWMPGSAPPTLPPGSTLPSVPPRPSPALALSLGSAPRHKMSRSTANAAMLLTPPISPTEEVEFQGLDFAVTASSSNNSIQGVRTNSSQPTLTPSRPVPRLTRSTSSPIIRSPLIPTPGPGHLQVPNASSWLSVKIPGSRSRSPSPSLASQSSSQCTSVPGTPISLPVSTTDSAPAHLGRSSGSLIPATPDIPLSRGPVQNLESNVAISSPDSVAIMAMFPSVPSNHARSQAQEGVFNADGRDRRPPLTPPVTPAWVTQVFDMHLSDGFGESSDEITSNQNPMTLSGSLAQMRRQKRHGTRSSSSEHGHRKHVGYLGIE